ncbi:MAG: ribonuclease P protein component [Candidatus Harrisonbacteria bacterium RIFCSPLOWO2_02_FULL_41_13b]|uniref:Ribonuclease P protein component n=1 Tax=Candidatus Harrisonbacteria bacterium RIFCSPLOWO2_02_FULL_41_13b TaxID=1798409 RepID=A0A1G1ZV29_9BACT|nr:MAG: ribonuclease P protein component [Candidatus Harrisonbacteria bacterium RIFCSPLOWO2_02_FULL_41_13b]
MALSKKHRIKSKKDLDRIFKAGRSFRSHLLLVKVSKNSFSFCRGAVIVPSKFIQNAVLRNKVKRIVFSVLASVFTFCKVHVDVVVVIQSSLKENKFSEAKESLLEIFRKANIV